MKKVARNVTHADIVNVKSSRSFSMKKKIILAGILLVIAFVFANLNSNFRQTEKQVTAAPITKDVFSYKGEVGKDALALLKQKFTVTQGNSDLVTEIQGRKADMAKHEYWAFSVNGKMANVGPADYETTNNDLIEWKIEKY
jgi:hypothetical protein